MEESLSKSLFDADKLNAFKKNELIEMIMELQKEKDALKIEVNLSGIEKMVVELERSHALYLTVEEIVWRLLVCLQMLIIMIWKST